MKRCLVCVELGLYISFRAHISYDAEKIHSTKIKTYFWLCWHSTNQARSIEPCAMCVFYVRPCLLLQHIFYYTVPIVISSADTIGSCVWSNGLPRQFVVEAAFNSWIDDHSDNRYAVSRCAQSNFILNIYYSSTFHFEIRRKMQIYIKITFSYLY